MENNYESKESVKSNKTGNLLNIILIIMVIALGGYIVYDKLLVTKENESEKAEEKNNKLDKEDNTDIISDEEAYEIGKKLYDRILDPNLIKFSTDDEENYESHYNDGYPVANYDEIKSLFANSCVVTEQDGFKGPCLHYFVDFEDLHYYDAEKRIACKSELYAKNLKSKTNDRIVFSVDTILDSSNETKTNDFIIVKEDGEWKILEYYSPWKMLFE